jgi:dTMP kinase
MKITLKQEQHNMAETLRYIVVEGPDGVGSTTQKDLLVSRLNGIRANAIGIREPGETAIGKNIRTILKDATQQRSPQTNLDLFTADRRETIDQVVRPHVKSGGIVVSDRNWVSSVAYQVYAEQSGLSIEDVERVTKAATGEFFTPDLLIMLTASQKTMSERRRGRDGGGTDFFESQGEGFMTRVAEGYSVMAERLGATVISAEPSVQEVFDQIWGVVEPKL